MKLENQEPHAVIKLLKVLSAIQAAELPAIAIAIMAFIPGLLDEALVGAGVLVITAALKLVRRYIMRHRDSLLAFLAASANAGKLSNEELTEGQRLINSLTVAGNKINGAT